MKDTRLNISIIICMFMPRKYGKSFLQEMAILVKLLKLSRDIKKSIDTAMYKSSFQQHPPDFAATSQKLVATHIVMIAVYEAKSYCIQPGLVSL